MRRVLTGGLLQRNSVLAIRSKCAVWDCTKSLHTHAHTRARVPIMSSCGHAYGCCAQQFEPLSPGSTFRRCTLNCAACRPVRYSTAAVSNLHTTPCFRTQHTNYAVVTDHSWWSRRQQVGADVSAQVACIHGGAAAAPIQWLHEFAMKLTMLRASSGSATGFHGPGRAVLAVPLTTTSSSSSSTNQLVSRMTWSYQSCMPLARASAAARPCCSHPLRRLRF